MEKVAVNTMAKLEKKLTTLTAIELKIIKNGVMKNRFLKQLV